MKQIIVVDDDEGIRDIFSLALQRAGYSVKTYSSGKYLIGAYFELPDVIILDKQLPGIDGLDVCRYLKKQEKTRDIPVIMISAYPYVGKLAKNAGADDFLEKPFKMKKLLEMVAKYL